MKNITIVEILDYLKVMQSKDAKLINLVEKLIHHISDLTDRIEKLEEDHDHYEPNP